MLSKFTHSRPEIPSVTMKKLHGKPNKERIEKTTQKSAVAEKKGSTQARPVMDSRSGKDRRASADRRQHEVPVAAERRKLQRRVKVSRRRQIDPTTCERDYTLEEIEFMSAMDDYKRRSVRMFPTCSEVLEVFRSLGYEKRSAVAAPVSETLDSFAAPAMAQSQA
jgi:hypothetical protein